MRILYVALKHDYGKPEQGFSFEHFNFYDSLLRMGHDILYFDFMGLMRVHGRDGMNRRLEEVARAEAPDLMFTVLFRDELDRPTVRRISEETDTLTLNWFCDDHWRFEELSRPWAPCFNAVVTTSRDALPKYERLGIRNVIRSQWACNHLLYRRLDRPLTRDISFVGQPHGDRRAIVDAMRAADLDVEAWGQGWETGRVDQDRMIEIFNESRINLNLANASTAPPTRAQRIGRAGRTAASAALDSVPGGAAIKALRRRLMAGRNGGRGAPPPGAALSAPAAAPSSSAAASVPTGGKSASASHPTGAASSAAPNISSAVPSQIKGRNFEVPGCGGFLLTDPAEDLDAYYEPGREVAVFENLDDLIDKARYYLAHEDERAAIARAGYERTLREHTYARRFGEIFQKLGLPETDEAGEPGEVVEVR